MTFRDKAWSPYAAGVLDWLAANSCVPADRNRIGDILVLRDDRGSHRRSRRRFHRQDGLPRQAYVRRQEHLAGGHGGRHRTGRIHVDESIRGSIVRSISPVWKKAVGLDSLSGRAPMAFAGGFIMVLGARIADGCTTGHGISGMAQLAVGSTVAVAAMFVGAIATALMMKRV